MNKSNVLENISIVISVISVYIIEHSPLSEYTSYLLAFLIIFSAIYISIQKRSKSSSELFTGSFIEIYAIITIILLIVVLTGGLASPLFFFIYFILFLLAFMCESSTIWIFLMSLLLYFAPITIQNPTSDTLIKVASLVLIAPIAYFVAREFERRSLLNSKIQNKTDEIVQQAEILKSTGKSADENEAIDEIIEEAESLNEDTKS